LKDKRETHPPYDSVTTPLTESEPPPLRNRNSNEDLSQEDLSKEQQQVVVPAAHEDFCKSDIHRISLTKGWSPKEVEKSWEVFQRNRHIVTSPIEYIEGVITKMRVISQAKDTHGMAP